MSLNEVNTETEKNEIRHLQKVVSSIPGVNLLEQAFDVEKWKFENVGDAFAHDTGKLLEADLAIFFFWNVVDSDVRGGKLILRLLTGKPTVVIEKDGIRISRFIHDGIARSFKLPIYLYETVEQAELRIRHLVGELERNPDFFVYKQPDYLIGLQDNTYEFSEVVGRIMQTPS